jgi:hypothetical protein
LCAYLPFCENKIKFGCVVAYRVAKESFLIVTLPTFAFADEPAELESTARGVGGPNRTIWLINMLINHLNMLVTAHSLEK